MCVRYTLHKTDAALNAISLALGAPLGVPDWATPRYNVTLTTTMPVVANVGEGAAVRPMRWGLIPFGGHGANPKLIANARAETVAALPAFRKAAATRRCLVPADGFYEWLTDRGQKLPYLFTLSGGEPFAFAGIWDPAVGELPEAYCILTTEPNELVAQVHNRMPVILSGDAMPRWMGTQPLSPEELKFLTRPLEASRMESRRVSRYMSNSRNEGPQCLAPPDSTPAEPELDFG
jgi:putative SOS response-associated peptidase YedK